MTFKKRLPLICIKDIQGEDVVLRPEFREWLDGIEGHYYTFADSETYVSWVVFSNEMDFQNFLLSWYEDDMNQYLLWSLRRTTPDQMAKQIIGVQPMTGVRWPTTGQIYIPKKK